MGWLVLLAFGVLLVACSTEPSGSPRSDATDRDRPSSTVPPSATPRPTPKPTALPVPAAGTYVALGDSLAVGVGAEHPDEGGYVARLFAELSAADRDGPQATRLTNVAVSGETSDSIIRDGQLARGARAIGEADPPVSLVTLDIGGNDLLRLLTAEPCASQPDGAACQGQVRGTLASFEVNLRRVLDELRAALDLYAPDAPLLVMTYFNPFSGTDAIYERGGEVALLGEDLTIDCQAASDPAMRGINDIILCVAGEAGAIGVDVHPRFTALGLELTHIGAQDIHANDRGYEVIAAEMLAELDRHTSPASAGRSAMRSALHLQ